MTVTDAATRRAAAGRAAGAPVASGPTDGTAGDGVADSAAADGVADSAVADGVADSAVADGVADSAVADGVADSATHPFRRRLLDGLAGSIAERGYRETTIADIVRHARTSKRTFYQEFGSKEECFIELLWMTNQEMMAQIRAAVDPQAHWQHQICQAIDAYVDSIESRPAITLSWIREMPALGAAERSVQRRGIEALTEMLIELTASPGFRRAHLPPISKPIAVILLGGLRELTAQTVEDKRDVREIVDAAVSASIAVVGATAH